MNVQRFKICNFSSMGRYRGTVLYFFFHISDLMPFNDNIISFNCAVNHWRG